MARLNRIRPGLRRWRVRHRPHQQAIDHNQIHPMVAQGLNASYKPETTTARADRMLQTHGRIALIAAFLAGAALHYGLSVLSLGLAIAALIYLLSLMPLRMFLHKKRRAPQPVDLKQLGQAWEQSLQIPDVQPWTDVIQNRPAKAREFGVQSEG